MVALLAITTLAMPAMAATFEFHGDLNNRFNLYTNQSQLYSSVDRVQGTNLQNDDNSAFWGDIKYRLWTEAASNDGAVKGVYAIELGAVRFGREGGGKSQGGAYSGDGVNIETRWAYTDFQLPGVSQKARVQIGLFPWSVNSFVWDETATGVQIKGDAGSVAYNLGWARGREVFPTSTSQDAFQDADALLARVDLKPAEGVKLGLFALYQREEAFDGVATYSGGTNFEIKYFGNYDYSIYTLGVDGGLSAGNLFVNWDAIYQGGTVDLATSLDVSGFLLHADVGANLGKTKITYTAWYASGDDDASDDKINNFLSTDVDRFDSIIFFEGGYTDDNYMTEAPYILDKGMILNKLAVDHKATEKTTVGGALLYLMTAEDLANGESALGTEVDAYVSHKLYPNVELALNAGYLFSDDGMANFSASGQKEDVMRITSRLRYKF